jgi:hypothetical protein
MSTALLMCCPWYTRDGPVRAGSLIACCCETDLILSTGDGGGPGGHFYHDSLQADFDASRSESF